MTPLKNFYVMANICLLFFSFSTSPLNAQSTTGIRKFWKAQLPGGNYIVALDSITSVSMHDYVVDGTLKVTEVAVDTSGNILARFYSVEKLRQNPASQAVKSVGEKTGLPVQSMEKVASEIEKKAEAIVPGLSEESPLWKEVNKNYPTTTHAHTVEYRLSNKNEAQKLFESIQEAFVSNQAGEYSP